MSQYIIIDINKISFLGFTLMQTKIKLEHVISFSDAIFAFSITFMAISIQIPNLPENLTQTQVIQSLVRELIPRLTIYAISFFVIGLYWISYHQIFNYIVGSHASPLNTLRYS